MPLSDAALRAARARIAALLAPVLEPAALGTVQLRPDQRDTAARVRAQLARDGGCLLADDVGRRKTYVALAVARRWSRPLVVIPASLRATWSDAMRRAGCVHALVTHEALSHGHVPTSTPDFVIVDESHRFRNPQTRRHAALARIAARCPLLMLSATPVQNATRDLAAQLSLFLGGEALRLTEPELVRYVVRGGEGRETLALPDVAAPVWLRPAADDGHLLRTILSLPAPPRALDAGDAGTLRTIALVRAWASSRAALRATVAKRRRSALALEQSVEAGRIPTRRELHAWDCGGGKDVQLGLVSLLVEERGSGEQLRRLAKEIAAERDACEVLDEAVRRSPDPDAARCEALRQLRRDHPDARLLCFSERATTVRAYFGALRADGGVGMLTANDSRIASGRLPRDELLALFAPRAQGAREPPARARVTLLLATDLLSEGMNLQDASVVVHLDLPWNPARLAQRVGRVRRVGGAPLVRSYLIAPPGESELLLQVEDRLRHKLASAESTIGRSMPVIPTLTDRRPNDGASRACNGAASAADRARTLERIAQWRDATARGVGGELPIVAGVESPRHGWLAAFSDGRLVASIDGAPPDSATSVVHAAQLADGASRMLGKRERDDALAAIERWRLATFAAEDAGVGWASGCVQRLTLVRGADLVAKSPRHARPSLVPLLTALRHSSARPATLGMERELAALLQRSASPVDARWFLQTALDVLRRETRRSDDEVRPHLVGLIVLGAAALRNLSTDP